MSTRSSHLLAMFLGISLAVLFYEGRQLVWNTAKALSVVQQQLSGTPHKGRRPAVRQAVEEQGPDAVAQLRAERRKMLAERGVQRKPGRGEARAMLEQVKAERKQRLQERWQELTPEQRAAVKERRQARLAQRRGKAPPRKPRPASAEEPAAVDRELPDDLLLDTGLLPQER